VIRRPRLFAGLTVPAGILLALAMPLTACEQASLPSAPPLPAASFPPAEADATCDADHDGYESTECGGLDCDDANGVANPGAVEECGNGVDDNCDGVVDEGCGCSPGDLQACWDGEVARRHVGACTDGVRRCGADGTWGACTFAVTPTAEAEACDGVDSDCDGVKDPASCGACPVGAVEICGNGLDDDCDGVIDPRELCTLSCDVVNPRETQPGNMECCLRSPPAIHDSRCYEGAGLDSCPDRACLDLDGSLETRCSKLCDGTGCICGRRESSGQIVAVADCGFLTPCARLDCGDEKNQPCYSGPPATLGIGICHGGKHSCEGEAGHRAWDECLGEQTPSPEVCGNGLDDDCDGSIDEEDGATGIRCESASVGHGGNLRQRCR
jgi:hypothetical protein